MTSPAPSPFPEPHAPLEELDALIADQKRDMQSGDRVWSYSLDQFADVDAILATQPRVATDDRHGTLYCYVRLRCRCAKCRAVSAEYQRDRRRRAA